MARKPGKEDYKSRNTHKIVIEVGGKKSQEYMEALIKLALVIGAEMYQNTKEDDLPTMPVRMGAFKGVPPGWEELSDELDLVGKEDGAQADSIDKIKEMFAKDGIKVDIEQIKEKGDSEDSGDSFVKSIKKMM